ncbi:hypothetical protein JWG39_13485 [Desulforhopalus vacuolatus]|uniref:hypothetical protein n=1 Tax=Desulforhopalus vacuolatus TaxID=40414 RepID=UPI001964B1D0|nr:hypothetical protein [Desulforhopalus vacuolatus]MBM9520830.1 hypothetical protein [Desulforhopalus vacuolatus]
MRFLFKTLLVSCALATALLFWWRPAGELMSLKPVDWAALYEKQYTFRSSTLSQPLAEFVHERMYEKQHTFRLSTRYRPLAEFIREEIEGKVSRIEGDSAQTWRESHFPRSRDITPQAVYFNPADVYMKKLEQQGYLEIRSHGSIDHLSYIRLDATDLDRGNIPNSLRFPYRTQALSIFALVFIFLGLMWLRPGKPDLVGQSSVANGCKFFLALLIGGVALVVLPFLYFGGERHKGMEAMVIGSCIITFSIIGLAIYGYLAAAVSKLIRGEGLLAHWIYDPDEWRQYTELNFRVERSKLRLLAFISLIILCVSGSFCLTEENQAAVWVFVFLLGILVLIWLTALVAPWLTYRRNLRGSGQVFIGKKGIYLNGTVHTWGLPGSRYESVEYMETPVPGLVFVYSYLMTVGQSLSFVRQYVTVYVPIPKGKEQEGKDVLDTFNADKR